VTRARSAGNRTSAGILLYRRRDTGVEVLLGHMGGPFWARKDTGAWSIPKGEHGPDDDPFAEACREFAEELGSPLPAGPVLDLGTVTQSRKSVRAWAVEGDFDVATVVSNSFEMEWPPRSGRIETFPELDRVEWFDLDTARTKVVAGQVDLLDRLARHISPAAPPSRPDPPSSDPPPLPDPPPPDPSRLQK
jgi:predicted NUDIX family NTP pyrophosphohydrolase